MKIRSLFILVGLAIGFIVPAFSQQKDTVDPEIAQQIRAVLTKYDETFNKNDTAALAALFTEDGLFVTANDGTCYGRQAIEKWEADNYQRWHPSDLVHTVDQLIAVGNGVLAVGKYGCAVHRTGGRSKHLVGHYSWVLVREGDTWKIREEKASDESF